MLDKISCKLAEILLSYADDAKYEKEVYVYGFQTVLSTMVTLFSILFLSCLLSDAKSGLVFAAVFVPLRLFTGGYHASTYGHCFIISNLVFLSILLLKKMLWQNVLPEVWMAVMLLAMVYIVKKAPVIHVSQPINEWKQKRCKWIAKYIVLFDALLGICLMFTKKEIFCMFALSVCLVAVFMLLADKSILSWKEGKEDAYTYELH